MPEYYSTSHIVQLFDVAPQSVRNWSEQFARYLSSAAAPGKGRNRTFTADDMGVFALIVAMKKTNASNDEIHASLSSGLRGSLPDLPPPADIQTLVVSDHAKALMSLKQRIEVLEIEQQNTLSELQKSREENIQLHSKNDLLYEQLKASQDEIKSLNREIGKLSARIDDD